MRPNKSQIEMLRPSDIKKPDFNIIHADRRRPISRRAVACGTIRMAGKTIEAIKNGTLLKGNVLALVEAAGIMGAKNAPHQILMCHMPPLDHVMVHCHVNKDSSSITIYVQVMAFSKATVEISAMAGVNAGLLTIWDMMKEIDSNLDIDDNRLLMKTCDTGDIWINPKGIPAWLEEQLPDRAFLKNKSAAILVMSDRAAKGEYNDESGTCLKNFLTVAGADIKTYNVIPDDADLIENSILKICREYNPDLLMTSGGTGPGPRDVTPDVLVKISDRILDGLGDVLRSESLYFTDTAWLSRMTAGMIGTTLVIAFPGSPKAVKECWDILAPFLGDALNKIKNQGFESLK